MPTFSGAELAEWSGGSWEPAAPREVRGVSTDTRSLADGSLYVALKGRNFDGHNFVDQAFEKRAGAALVGRGYSSRAESGKRPLLRVDDTLAALQRLARGYRRQTGVEIVGVTGSAGKTTVKEMTAGVLSVAAPVARTLGNWNNDIGVPLSLLAMERTARLGVFEVGTNHPGELAPLCALIEPSWAIVTNIGPVHLEFFGSLAGVAAEKGELLRALPPDGVAVLWKDDVCFNQMKALVRGRVVTVSTLGDADYVLARMSQGHAVIRETQSGGEMTYTPARPGEHNIRNSLFAVAVGRGHGMKWDDIRSGLENYDLLPMRWARETVRGVTIVNDAYNANPMSMRAALDTFAQMQAAGGKWLVLAGMLELGETEQKEHVELGRYAGRGKWAGLIAVGERGAWIADGAVDAGFDKAGIFRCADNLEAARVLAGRTAGGDAILLKGSRGMRLEEVRDKYVLSAV